MMGRSRIILDVSEIRRKYVDEHMKAEDIGKELGVSVKTVLRNLKRAGVKIRNRGYGFNVLPEVKFSSRQLDFFDGFMASDGSLYTAHGGRAKHNAHVSCGFKYKEFAEYIVNFLDLGVSVNEYVHYSDRYKSGECKQFKFLSKNNTFFTKEKSRWYPNGKKILPNDFRFSPVAMNTLYLCDGMLHGNTAYLCMQSFDRDNTKDILVDNLKKIGIRSWMTKENMVAISARTIEEFFDYIGNCPVDCYSYKWGIKKEMLYPKPIDKDSLKKMYWVKSMSCSNIAESLGVSTSTVLLYMKKYNIERRSLSESIKIARSKNK